MPVTIGTSAGNKTVDEVWVGTSAGNKQVLEGWIGTTAGNKQIFSAALVFLQDGSYSDTGAAGIGLTNTGLVQATGISDYTWLLIGAVGDYQVRTTKTSGTSPSGTLATWLGLGTSRAWTLSGTGVTCNLTVEIRDVATSTVQATAYITLTAN
jgi:hypothetical protein